jgi:hypothetical protein
LPVALEGLGFALDLFERRQGESYLVRLQRG